MTEDGIQTAAVYAGEEFQASEDSVAVYCDPCKFDSTETEAEGYCHDCNEYLCKQCLLSHRKFRAFRDHNILVGDSIPKCKAENSQRFALKLCDDHRMNEVQFYCCDHKSVLCSLCKAAKHSACDCKLIKDICKTDNQTSLKQATEDIESIKKEFENLKTSDIERIDAIKGASHKCKAKLNLICKQMSDFFVLLEKEIDFAETQQESSITDLRENVAIYTDAINHISSVNEHIQQVSKANDNIAIFAAEAKLKKLQAEYLIVKETLHFKGDKKVPRQPYEKIMIVKEMCDNICEKIYPNKQKKAESTPAPETHSKTIENQHQHEETMVDKIPTSETSALSCKTDFSPAIEGKIQNFKNLKIRQKFLVSIQTEDDGSGCNITDSMFLPNRYLVLCDFANSTLILLDKDITVIDKLKLETRPWGVALINANKIVVTLPDQKKLLYITIESRKLCQGTCISLKGVCWGICTFNGNLIITFYELGKAYIEIRKLSGERVKTFPVDHENAHPNFYVAANQTKSNGCIYFTDGKSTLFCYTQDGQLLSKFRSDKIKLPGQMILDDHGDCIISSNFSKKLVLVTNNLSLAQDLWKDSDIFQIWIKQSRIAQTMSMCWENLTLIVGHNSKNQIQVIKMYKMN